jgi:transposase
MCFLEYRPARVRCPEHGVRVEGVPWARPGSRFTGDFEDGVAWLAVRCTASAVAGERGAGRRTVGGICRRVWRDLEAARGAGRFDGVRRTGVDETSYKKGHEYLAVEAVTADGARWIKSLVKRRCPNARRVTGPFHVVSRVNDALDAVRRDGRQVAKRAARDAAPARRDGPGRPRKGEGATPEARALREAADAIKGSRYALVKNPEDLTESQAAKLDEVRRAGSRPFGAWEPKGDLRAVFAAGDPGRAEALLDDWPRRAAYCKIPQVVAVEKKVRRRRDDVVAAVDLGLSNARVEAVNNKIKVTVRTGYGFRNVDNLVGLLMLRCSDVRPSLPGREAAVAA